MHGTVEQIFMMMKPGMPGPGGAGRSLSYASSRLWRSPGSILLRACGAGLPGSWNRVCPGHAVRHERGGLYWCACGLCSWHLLRFHCQQEFSAQLRPPVNSVPMVFPQSPAGDRIRRVCRGKRSGSLLLRSFSQVSCGCRVLFLSRFLGLNTL